MTESLTRLSAMCTNLFSWLYTEYLTAKNFFWISAVYTEQERRILPLSGYRRDLILDPLCHCIWHYIWHYIRHYSTNHIWCQLKLSTATRLPPPNVKRPQSDIDQAHGLHFLPLHTALDMAVHMPLHMALSRPLHTVLS